MAFVATAKYPSAIAGVSALLNQKNVFPANPLVTLASTIAAGDTSIAVLAGTGQYLPSDNFVISIDNEIIFITSRSTDTLTVGTSGRGYEGSTAASHATGVTVTARVTALAHNQLAVEVNAIETALGANYIAPALELIASVTTSGGQTSVTFSSIPATYTDLIVTVRGQATYTGATYVTVVVQFNGDTGSNYDSQLFQISSNSPFGAGQLGAAVGWIATLGSTAVANSPSSSLEFIIPGYALTAFQKNGICNWNLKLGTSTGNIYVGMNSVFWRSTAAINSILVALSTNTNSLTTAEPFVNGSVVSLYGRR